MGIRDSSDETVFWTFYALWPATIVITAVYYFFKHLVLWSTFGPDKYAERRKLRKERMAKEAAEQAPPSPEPPARSAAARVDEIKSKMAALETDLRDLEKHPDAARL